MRRGDERKGRTKKERFYASVFPCRAPLCRCVCLSMTHFCRRKDGRREGADRTIACPYKPTSSFLLLYLYYATYRTPSLSSCMSVHVDSPVVFFCGTARQGKGRGRGSGMFLSGVVHTGRILRRFSAGCMTEKPLPVFASSYHAREREGERERRD